MAHPPVPRFTLLVLCGVLAACGSAKSDVPSTASPAIRTPGAAAPLAVVGVAWDNFNHRGNMWACRDLASGDIVSTSMCHGLVKDDRHWPGMAVPSSYRGMPDP
mgnify:CR=1 FL=1